tara:strand:+ start:5642 stop:6190 length:549 start_codon:yes stop_codon:yes gene_type:complete
MSYTRLNEDPCYTKKRCEYDNNINRYLLNSYKYENGNKCAINSMPQNIKNKSAINSMPQNIKDNIEFTDYFNGYLDLEKLKKGENPNPQFYSNMAKRIELENELRDLDGKTNKCGDYGKNNNLPCYMDGNQQFCKIKTTAVKDLCSRDIPCINKWNDKVGKNVKNWDTDKSNVYCNRNYGCK